MKEFVSVTMVLMETGEKKSSYHSKGCQEEKRLIKNMNLIDIYYRVKFELIRRAQDQKKMSQPQKFTF